MRQLTSSPHALIVATFALLLPAFGCDRDSGASADNVPVDQRKHDTPKPRPTTQELLSGKRRSVRLGIVPLSVMAPESWEVKSQEDLAKEMHTFLQGPAPHDEIAIQLARRAPMTAEEIALTAAGAKKEMKENPESIRVVDVREEGNVKLLERQTVGRPTTLELKDAQNKSYTVVETPYRWQISVFVPTSGKALDVYELNFVGLTKDEFEADQSFLREIVDSLHYDAAAQDLSILEKPEASKKPALP